MGQPDVKRKNTSLRAQADKCQHKNDDFGRLGQSCGIFETKISGMGIDQTEGRQDEHGPDLGNHKLEIAGLPVLLGFIVVYHQKKR